MTCRGNAEAAIRRWTHDFHLDQKDLAGNVGVSTSAISHIVNDPGYTISDELARRIVTAVEQEAGTRIAALPMEVVALCHDTGFVLNEVGRKTMMQQIKNALAASAFSEAPAKDPESVLPDGVSAVLIRVGGLASRFFLIVLNVKNSDEEKRALAHELEHLKAMILKGVAKTKAAAPRSSY